MDDAELFSYQELRKRFESGFLCHIAEGKVVGGGVVEKKKGVAGCRAPLMYNEVSHIIYRAAGLVCNG